MAKDTQIPNYAREGGVGLDIDRCIITIYAFNDQKVAVQ